MWDVFSVLRETIGYSFVGEWRLAIFQIGVARFGVRRGVRGMSKIKKDHAHTECAGPHDLKLFTCDQRSRRFHNYDALHSITLM